MSKNMAVLDDNGKVLNIIVCQDNQLQTKNLITYTDENIAYIGGNYIDGYFYPPQPYPSWSLDENFDWNAPNPMPTEGFWSWNESSLSWVESTIL
jgi:hypothetical protein